MICASSSETAGIIPATGADCWPIRDHPGQRHRLDGGQTPAFLPNLGGTIPNDAFSDILGLPTIWVPHSYGGCSQHAPDEYLLAPIVREGLQIMAGLFWDLAENAPHVGTA